MGLRTSEPPHLAGRSQSLGGALASRLENGQRLFPGDRTSSPGPLWSPRTRSLLVSSASLVDTGLQVFSTG